jgi:hypothetical protein
MMVGDIIPEFATPITVRRPVGAVTFVDGIEQPASDPLVFCISCCSVQPVTGREREVLPELIRDREVSKTYTQYRLRSVDVEGKTLADRVDWQDEEYVVQSVEDWYLHGRYYKVLLVKEDD